MAFGTNHITSTEASIVSGRTRSNSAFIRELWTDEFLAVYKANQVMPGLVKTMPFHGKKGDTVHIPRFATRGSGTAKAEEAAVTLVSTQASQTNYLIDTHWHYAVMIDDLVNVQADDSLRSFYTDDMGYALTTKVDTDLHAEGAKFAGADAAPTVEGSAYSKAVVGTPTAGALVAWDATANTNTGNESVLTDEGIRLLIKELDDNDVPSAGRVLVIPPVEKKNLLGIPRFTEQAFVGEGNSIRNGQVGSLYNTDVFVSTNCATVDDATTPTAGTNQRAALYFQKDSIVFIEQMAPRVQSGYELEWLGDLMVADTIYGSGVLRPEAGIAVVVPA
jgi:N4-gp56 family major capsid protein